MDTTVTVTEDQRQGILLALGHLAVERPGWAEAFLKPIADKFEDHGSPMYEQFRRTWDRLNRDVCLQVSHSLLRTYAELLNLHDGGERKIPERLEDWIDRCVQCEDSSERLSS